MRVTFVQFGNYAEAVHRFAKGGKEDFYAQRYTVDFVAELAKRTTELTVVHLGKDDPVQVLPNGVKSVGIELYPAGKRARHFDLIGVLRRLKPDQLILCTPNLHVLLWAIATGVRTLPLFADSFDARGLRSRVLSGLLNRKKIEWVANHNIRSCESLLRIGVTPDKVLPFDWPALMKPIAEQKTLRTSDEYHAVYVGQVNEPKGVKDAIDAINLLNGRSGPRWKHSIIGGLNDGLQSYAAGLPAAARIEFVGRIPHDKIVTSMREHDVVLIPSRHEYPEGLPMTIYEALCSRSPIVASDHPMFSAKLKDGVTALIFKEKNAEHLAAQLAKLVSSPAIYAQLSAGSAAAADSFFCPLKYDDLITRWLNEDEANRRYLAQFSMSTGRYA